jgi:hypothetical protein
VDDLVDVNDERNARNGRKILTTKDLNIKFLQTKELRLRFAAVLVQHLNRFAQAVQLLCFECSADVGNCTQTSA